ncbi:hypothetical protein ZEAMMB73_Zm00001d025297 [Zea mays]|uniref:Uncharacterized protein n=1 Tax=Zea mays TaxID=4577 RepID=A0A1D6J6C3_MAIZE|nr:hypothetical protein ZEAMMB73_Zm00001d025297 [Zea mays]
MAASTTQRPAGSHARRPRSTNRPCMHAYEDVVVPPIMAKEKKTDDLTYLSMKTPSEDRTHMGRGGEEGEGGGG